MSSEKTASLVFGGAILGYIFDKYFNDGKIAEQMGTTLHNSREILTEKGGEIKELVTERVEIFKEIMPDVNLDGLKDGLNDLKDKLPGLPNVDGLFNFANNGAQSPYNPSFWDKLRSGTNATYEVISGQHNILSRSAGILASPFVWFAQQPKNIGTSAGEVSASATTNLYDNIKNTAQIAKAKITNKKASVTRYITSSNNSKFVGNKDVDTTIIKKTNGDTAGSYNSLAKASLSAEATKISQSPLGKALGW